MGTLSKAAAAKPDIVPKGWLTSQQWAVKEKLSQITVSAYLSRLVRQGTWEVKKFRIPNGQSGVRPVPHYRPKP